MKLVIIIFILLIVVAFRFPLKAAKRREFLEGKEYIICNEIKTTGFDWVIIESSYGYEGYVKLEGKIPLSEYNSYPYTLRFNDFICFGEFIGEELDERFYHEPYKIFRVDSWEFLYPIIREETLLPEFIYPKYGLVSTDIF